MKDKLWRIKSDLRQLRKLQHSVDVAMEARGRHERRLAVLQAMDVTDLLGEDLAAHIEEIERLRMVIETLGVEETIKRATELERKYMGAIGKLDQLDRTIIMDAYLNGKPYWKIGRDIGYSERGVQNRVSIILERLSKSV